MVSAVISMSLGQVWHLCNLPRVYMHCLGSVLLEDMFLKLSNRLLSRDKISNLPWTRCFTACILYFDVGTGWSISEQDSYHSSYHFCPRTFFLRDVVALLRESYTLVLSADVLIYFSHPSDRAYVSWARCIGLFLLLCVLVPHDSSLPVYEHSSTLTMLRASLFCVLYMPVVGLIVQVRPWFSSIVHVDCDSHHALHVRVLSLRFMLLLYT